MAFPAGSLFNQSRSSAVGILVLVTLLATLRNLGRCLGTGWIMGKVAGIVPVDLTGKSIDI
ncbi:MAG: hypothetical protein EPN30_04040 [Actinomycetota bacterium]|nr:MAG: hypothetical protein EPN30_04040 [Actinomycetota bacterium]